MIIKNSIIFIVFELINKAIPFLLLPILTRYLTPEDYGVIASFSVLLSFVGIFIGLSAHGAIDANFFRLEKNKLSIYIANVFIILLCTTFSILLIVVFFHEYIAMKLVISFEWQVLAILVSLGQFITVVNLSLWVIEQKPIPYGVYQFLQTITISLLALILIIGFSFAWEGQLIAVIIGTIIFSFFSLVILYKREYLNLQIDDKYMKDFLKFGLPMIPHQFAGWIRTQGDKVIIISLLGTGMTGIFMVGQQIGMVMSILMSSFTKALYPILFKSLSQELLLPQKRKIVIFTYILFVCIWLIGFTLILVLEFFYPYLLGVKFQDAIHISRLLIFSFMFEGMYFCVVGYIFYFKKTNKLAKITFLIAILHLTFSYIAIERFAIMGAGYALVLSSFLQFVFVWHLSNKIYPMPWFSFWEKSK